MISIRTYFKAEIKNIGINELSYALDALHGRHILLTDKDGKVHDPVKMYFWEPKRYISIFPYSISENPEECLLDLDNVAFGNFKAFDITDPSISFNISVNPDKAPDLNYCAGYRIIITDFTDKPYSSDIMETDFKFLSNVCKHLGYAYIEISEDFKKREATNYASETKAYHREIKDQHLNTAIRNISKILVDEVKAGVFDYSKLKDLNEIDKVYDHYLENREKSLSHDYEPLYLYQRAVVKGYYLSGMKEKDYIERLTKNMFGNKEDLTNINRDILAKYDRYKAEYEDFLGEEMV